MLDYHNLEKKFLRFYTLFYFILLYRFIYNFILENLGSYENKW